MKLITSHIFNALGWISFILGVVGAFLPIMPTTPFILLASYFFSKGSPRFHNWLTNLKYFGPKIKNWEQYGVIDKSSKVISTLTLILLSLYFWISNHYGKTVNSIITVIFTFILIFISTRPSKTKSVE